MKKAYLFEKEGDSKAKISLTTLPYKEFSMGEVSEGKNLRNLM